MMFQWVLYNNIKYFLYFKYIMFETSKLVIFKYIMLNIHQMQLKTKSFFCILVYLNSKK